MKQEQIDFRIGRDFGETFNVSIRFLRQNFRAYFLCILLLAGPFVLLDSFGGAYYQSVIINKVSLVKAGLLYNMNAYSWEYFASLFLHFISSLALMCCTYSYMIVYSEKGIGNFTVNDVVKKMSHKTGKIIGGFFLFFFLILIFSVAIGVVIGLTVQAAQVIGAILVIVLFIGAILITPNILWQLSTSFLVILSDNEIPFIAFGRTREVMKNNYWWTWLITVCSSLVVFVLALLFALPTTIFSLIKIYSTSTEVEETSVLFLITFTVCAFFAALVYSILYLICGFHYFSLTEKKDGIGLMERINEIGNSISEKREETF